MRLLACLLILVAGAPGGLNAQVRAPAAADPISLTADERRLILDAVAASAPLAAALSDRALVLELMSYARRERGLRLRPASIDRLWGLSPAPHDVERSFAQARASGSLRRWLEELSPRHPQYQALQAAAARYRHAAAATFRPIGPFPTLREGDTHPDLASIRSRLAAEGFPPPVTDSRQVFDSGLKAALVSFQQRRGLEADGVLGPVTLAALNTSPAQRLVQIEANLERLRWLPRELPSERVEVNVAAAEAVLIRADQPVLRMRAVVGDTGHKTPMFTSKLEAVVFNPPWNVPASIARNEIWPKAARDPGYLARNHFVTQGGRLQQRPGPHNALGQIKFDLQSPYGVYLHDTPTKSAFQRSMRALSHGCMRLEKPRALAEALLAPQGWSAAEVDSAIVRGTTQRVALARPTPLYVIYLTAMVEDGQLRFASDTYGWDLKLAKALTETSRPSTVALNATDCAEAQPAG